ncbi:MAG: hypothetical protein HY897_01980 [Deltaproteobacteria bacterium]|nr:hypothetical protein [Deltaproteobacteria bacterium]
MRQFYVLVVIVAILGIMLPGVVLAQSIEDIQLKKEAGEKTTLGFGFLSTLEGAAGLNRDRPEYLATIYLAPQLKIGATMRAQLNVTVNRAALDRQDNAYGWYQDDFSLEFGHLKIWQEKRSGIALSASARYYIPVSKMSRDANSYGQARGYLKLSTTLWKFYLAAEGNVQKYFNEYTTWDTSEQPGTTDWFRQAGKDEYIENNTDYGFGETYTLGFSALEGLDLSLIWAMYQSRRYPTGVRNGDISGSSYLQEPRWTTWSHMYRFAADATYGIGAIPAVASSEMLKDSLLSNLYVSFGYNILAPQLKRGGAERNLDPFDPKFAALYFDLTFVY